MNNNPQRSADEPIMRPVEELEGEEDVTIPAAETPQAGQVIVGMAPFQSGSQLAPTPVPYSDGGVIRDEGAEARPEDDV